MTLLGLLLLQFVTLAALAFAAFGAGALITARLPLGDAAERLAITTAAGLGSLGTLLFFAGFDRRVVLLLAALSLVAGVRSLFATRPAAGGARFALFALAGIGAALLPAFAATLYPPTAYDATVYHLPFARAFVAAGRLVATPDLLFEVFPQLAEALFAATMAVSPEIGRDLAAPLVQWVAVAATALLLFTAGRRFYSTRAGLWAGSLWLAHPMVHYQASSAYVDATLALFCLLAAVAVELWLAEEHHGWIALAGAALGWSASTKYLGLLWAALLVAVVLTAAPRSRRLRGALLLLLVAGAVAAPWYVRNWAIAGNPFTPMFEASAGGPVAGPLGTRIHDFPAAVWERLSAVAETPVELARFAWRAVFVPAAFDRQAPLAPWSLALAPLALLFARRDRRLLRWLLIVLGYALFWTTTQPRFQLPAAALLALAGAGAIEHLAGAVPPVRRRLAGRGAAVALALVLLAPGPLYALLKLGRFGVLPPATPAARESFLDRQLPGHAGIRWLERERGPRYTVFLLGSPNLTYFASGTVRGQLSGPYRLARIRPLLGDPVALHGRLREMGADYLLATLRSRGELSRRPGFATRFRRVAGDERYDLYELTP